MIALCIVVVLCSAGLSNVANYSLFVVTQSSFVGAIAIGDLIKSTLGPKGMVRHHGQPMLCRNNMTNLNAFSYTCFELEYLQQCLHGNLLF